MPPIVLRRRGQRRRSQARPRPGLEGRGERRGRGAGHARRQPAARHPRLRRRQGAVKAPSWRRHGAGLRRPAPRPAGGHGDPQRGKNAVSVAGTLLLTEATLTEIREPETANPGGRTRRELRRLTMLGKTVEVPCSSCSCSAGFWACPAGVGRAPRAGVSCQAQAGCRSAGWSECAKPGMGAANVRRWGAASPCRGGKRGLPVERCLSFPVPVLSRACPFSCHMLVLLMLSWFLGVSGRGWPCPESRRELPSAGRMPERRQVRVSEAQDGRSERPAMGRGQPLPRWKAWPAS